MLLRILFSKEKEFKKVICTNAIGLSVKTKTRAQKFKAIFPLTTITTNYARLLKKNYNCRKRTIY